MNWQKRALEYVDIIPELNYAARFYARMLKQLRLYPATLDEDGLPVPVENADAKALLDRVSDPGGGRSQILGNYGKLSFITGEGTLFGRALNTEQEAWSYIWNEEIEVELDPSGGIRRIIHQPNGASGQKYEYGPNEAVAYRMWTSHPRLSGEADSPMRAALDIAEELIVLTMAVRATAVSRTTNGVLFLPLEGAPPPAETIGDEDAENDPFMSDFVEHLVAQKENAGTAEAAAPYVVWMASELIQNGIRFERIHDTQNDYAERDLRKEAIERLAGGLDFPPEVLLGLGSTNHWAAMQILQDMWRSHGVPVAEQFCHDLNQAYYRPALRDAGVPGWEEMTIAYDDSRVVVKPDRSEDADTALDRGALSYTGYRALKNIPEKWAATQEDLDWMLEAKGKSQPTPEPSPNVQESPPPPGPEGDSGRRTRVVASGSREAGAAEMALRRCREIAGNRIRNKARGKLSIPETVPAALVASAVGTDGLTTLGLPARSLVEGGSEAFKALLVSWGHTGAEVDALCEAVELYAARTLFSESVSLPASMETRITQMQEAAEA